MKIGVICPSEIAFRRFMPALENVVDLEFAGVAVCSAKEMFGEKKLTDSDIVVLQNERIKAESFIEKYGGKLYEGYENMVVASDIDAIYIPLPPALHYKWAKNALEHGKHVLVEKPSTISSVDTVNLVDIAKKRGLALHENYMFAFHNQIEALSNIVCSGEIGEIRLYRICFGFPKRLKTDFRYNRELGGGSLIDAGGYVIKYARRILGETAKLVYGKLNYCDDYDVDMYGSGAMINDAGTTVQFAFGMDNDYKCELEVWGSEGCLKTGRVLTAPVGFVPTVEIKKGNEFVTKDLPEDDSFKKSIEHFLKCIKNEDERLNTYQEMVNQAKFVDDFRMKDGLNE